MAAKIAHSHARLLAARGLGSFGHDHLVLSYVLPDGRRVGGRGSSLVLSSLDYDVRLLLGAEARALGHGGMPAVAQASGA